MLCIVYYCHYYYECAMMIWKIESFFRVQTTTDLLAPRVLHYNHVCVRTTTIL